VTICTHRLLCSCVSLFMHVWIRVSSNKHCTLFYSDPTSRQKQQAQPYLIICNGNSHHYHEYTIVVNRLSDFQEEGQSDTRMIWETHTNFAKANGKRKGACLVAGKRLCKHIHHSTHDWAHVVTTPVPSAPIVYTARSYIGWRLPWSP